MKLQTFLFQMVVTSRISAQYLWKYGFAKSSDNLYAPFIIQAGKPGVRIPAEKTHFISSPKRPDDSWIQTTPHSTENLLFLCVKRLKGEGEQGEIDDSHPPRVDVKNEWLYTSSPPLRLDGMYRNKVSLTEIRVWGTILFVSF